MINKRSVSYSLIYCDSYVHYAKNAYEYFYVTYEKDP